MARKVLLVVLALLAVAAAGVAGFYARGYTDHAAAATGATKPDAANAPVIGAATEAAETGDVHSALMQFSPFRLSSGTNHVDHLAGDGRGGDIIVAWHQGERGPNSYDVFMVVIGDKVAWREETNGREDIVSDAPFDGEQTVATVRLGRSIIDGRSATVLVHATRVITKGVAMPTPVRIDVYELKQDEGFGYDYFEKIGSKTTRNAFCNAELALLREENVPLTASYAGIKNADGCP